MKNDTKITAAVLGATGYSGLELLRILSAHPKVGAVLAYSSSHPGKKVRSLFPHLDCIDEGNCFLDPEDIKLADAADVYFLALPNLVSQGFAARLAGRGKTIIDLSADFRIAADTYGAWYGEHTQPKLLKKAVYGLTEIYADKLRGAELIANPGCYVTSALIPLIPLVRDGIIDSDGIIIDAKSGVSGGGRVAEIAYNFSEITGNFKAYKIFNHRHKPEIDEKLAEAAKSPIDVIFTPHLLPIERGILSTIYATLAKGSGYDEVAKSLSAAYSGSPFVRLAPTGSFPEIKQVKGTNRIDIGVAVKGSQLIIVSVLDNLIKGAAGQAVQNMNVARGYGESEGLTTQAQYP